jgi:hypothetical protein
VGGTTSGSSSRSSGAPAGSAGSSASPAGPAIGRRRFLELCGLGIAGSAAGAALLEIAGPATPARAAGAEAEAGSGRVLVGGAAIRPPAVPLAVRTPYTSAWLCGTKLPGRWASGWDGPTMAFCGLVRIDREPYVWCGDPGLSGVAEMTQTSLDVTATRTVFTLEDDRRRVKLEADWISPVEPGNPRLQSIPLSLLMVSVASMDGDRHAVELYCDISGQWASWDPSDEIVWQTGATKSRHWTVELAHRQPFEGEQFHGQMASTGAAVLSTPRTPFVTYQAGDSTAVRTAFVRSGRLPDSVDHRFREVRQDWPVFALSRNLGSVGKGPDLTWFTMGHFETDYGIEYLGQDLPPLWQTYWTSWQSMVDDYLGSAVATRERAMQLDHDLISAATSAGGPGYAALCSLAVRQAYGACQLVLGPGGRPWAFIDELSSGEIVQTVDIILDTSPLFLALDPRYLAMLIEPLLDYTSSGKWTEDYPPHSLGDWPVASGDTVQREQMPVQESSAMLVMAAAYAARSVGDAAAFLGPYKELFVKWARLVDRQLPVPPRQLTTLDYIGPVTADTNLAALGVVGLGAASQVFKVLGDSERSTYWSHRATARAGEWHHDAMDPSGSHLEGSMGTSGSWSNLYNAYWDKALSTGLIPSSVAKKQAKFYKRLLTPYGLPYGSASDVNYLGRVDLELWTAAWLYDMSFGPALLDAVVHYVDSTDYTVPFPDTYDVRTGGKISIGHNWRARPVVGGVFSLLALNHS